MNYVRLQELLRIKYRFKTHEIHNNVLHISAQEKLIKDLRCIYAAKEWAGRSVSAHVLQNQHLVHTTCLTHIETAEHNIALYKSAQRLLSLDCRRLEAIIDKLQEKIQIAQKRRKQRQNL